MGDGLKFLSIDILTDAGHAVWYATLRKTSCNRRVVSCHIHRFHDQWFYLDIEGAREKYLETLGNALRTYDSRVIAYCLISSHVHLVLQLSKTPLGTLTKRANSPFANMSVGIGIDSGEGP